MIRLTELLDESDAGDEARAKGLEYLSFGRYGKNGQVTHIVDPKTHKLVPKPAGEEPTTPKSNWVNRPMEREPGTEKWTAADFANDPRNGGPGDSHYQDDTSKDYTPQGSTAAKPAVSRSPDGSRGSKTPLAQDPKGDYGNPDMPTSMPKSTAPQPVEDPYQSQATSELSSDERWAELLKARDQVQKLIKKHTELGGRAAADHWTTVSGQLDNKARQMAMKEPPQNQHLAQYLINRGLMQDPTDMEEPTPRDASGASHFGPDN